MATKTKKTAATKSAPDVDAIAAGAAGKLFGGNGREKPAEPAAAKYRDEQGRELFVDSINGVHMTFWKKTNGSLVRVKSKYLPGQTSFYAAQTDLNDFAKLRNLRLVKDSAAAIAGNGEARGCTVCGGSGRLKPQGGGKTVACYACRVTCLPGSPAINGNRPGTPNPAMKTAPTNRAIPAAADLKEPSTALAVRPAPSPKSASGDGDVFEPLSSSEKKDLAKLESAIDRGLRDFVLWGAALSEISVRRLHRETHATFEDYCRERWDISRQHAYRWISAADVVGVLSPIGDKWPLPRNESQARALIPVDRDQWQDVWIEACKRAKKARSIVTGEIVEETVRWWNTPGDDYEATQQPAKTRPADQPTRTIDVEVVTAEGAPTDIAGDERSQAAHTAASGDRISGSDTDADYDGSILHAVPEDWSTATEEEIDGVSPGPIGKSGDGRSTIAKTGEIAGDDAAFDMELANIRLVVREVARRLTDADSREVLACCLRDLALEIWR